MVATTKVFVSLFSAITMAAAKVAMNANTLSPKSSFQLFVVPSSNKSFSLAIVDAVSDPEKKSDKSLCIYMKKGLCLSCWKVLSDHLNLKGID